MAVMSATRWTARSNNIQIADLTVVASAPAAATQATLTRAAGGAAVRHVCRRIIATVAAAAGAVVAPVNVNLRDGGTGAGTILASWALAAVVNTIAIFDADMLEIPGTANTAMTLEFAAASAAGSIQAVVGFFYTLST